MARPNKIEQLKLQKVIQRGVQDGLSMRQIATACSKAAGESVSHVAIARYLEMAAGEAPRKVTPDKKKEAITRTPERLEKLVNFDIDIIQLQYRTTAALLERFEFVDSLPHMFEERLSWLAQELQDNGSDTGYLDKWKLDFVVELRRNILSITTLNRELRENSKFMADLRSKAFEFELIQEYLYLFMEVFRKANPEAYEVATAQIAANPRMQRIVEQQQQLRGGEAE